ncbi:MAG TPA: XRE family transcriptional regulator [Candidatus Borkfalkia excrementigallinarum]|uniref:XRE family transcriptional regulator n=1 Tax=Candidatus Borkfalkia excrementigallinarum TaxID=2838506 RepID=A0A9D2CT00_9FIRM|nr:XRE family transcriptional regulator [Candidatus Borkfalkia excrementigallinarum]
MDITNNIIELFADNLKRLRKNSKLTQVQLAEIIGYSEKAVSKWECGIAIPPINALFLLSETFNVSLDELFAHASAAKYFLGIDGGGTKTDFALADSNGNIIRRLKLGPSNPIDIGFDSAAAILDEGIRKVTFGLPKNLISVFAGIAGNISESMKKEIAAFLSQYNFFYTDNGSDAENIIAAGLGKHEGIALIMGTGCSAFVQKEERHYKIGGLGYLFDHGGSAYDIGNYAIRAACCAEDGSGEDTLLRQLFLDQLNTKTVTENLPYFYSISKKGIASYAPIVFTAYRAGDAVAEQILRRNMNFVANLMLTGRKRLGYAGKTYAVIVGGLTRESDILLPMLYEHLKKTDDADNFEINIFKKDVIEGALLRAGLNAPIED